MENAIPSNRLYVGNLAWSTGSDELMRAFADYGSTGARVIVDRGTMRSKGFGFVSFLDEIAAQEAIDALDETDLGGRQIRVKFAEPPGATLHREFRSVDVRGYEGLVIGSRRKIAYRIGDKYDVVVVVRDGVAKVIPRGAAADLNGAAAEIVRMIENHSRR